MLGVATVIKARTPLCTGVHHPVQPHTSPTSQLPRLHCGLGRRHTSRRFRLLRCGLCYALLLAAGSVCRVPPLCTRWAVWRRLLTLYWSVRMARVLWLVTRVASVGARAC